MSCGHTGCTCQAAEGQEFCSDHCREHAAMSEHPDHACGCGHAACTM
ncbi:MAG TPA: hypothetical protein VFR44_07510 [Actinomycetota bacterium]|nr:hypothetical protein [Actinomycetota bacterium]